MKGNLIRDVRNLTPHEFYIVEFGKLPEEVGLDEENLNFENGFIYNYPWNDNDNVKFRYLAKFSGTTRDDRIPPREGYWEEEYEDPIERQAAIEKDNYRRLTFIFTDVESLIEGPKRGLDWVSYEYYGEDIENYPNIIKYNFRSTFLPMRIYNRNYEKTLEKGNFKKLDYDVKGHIFNFLEKSRGGKNKRNKTKRNKTKRIKNKRNKTKRK
jgi:hypothetical protein